MNNTQNTSGQHTKGQWIIETDNRNTKDIRSTDTGEVVATIWFEEDGPLYPAQEQQEANARLISASPQLLEALQALTKWVTLNTDAMPAELINAKAAINKATI